MDRYLFEKFVFEMDDELYDNSCVAIAQMSENIVKTPHSNMITFNYYPQEQHKLQLVAQGCLEEDEVQIEDVKIHHAAQDVWKLKIVTDINECNNSYLATRPDGNGLVAIRLVNEQVLENIESDSTIEAQVVAFAIDVNIYENEEAYADSVTPTADGQNF